MKSAAILELKRDVRSVGWSGIKSNYYIIPNCIYYLCHSENREISLNEHISHKWIFKSELENLNWAAADIPIVDKLRDT